MKRVFNLFKSKKQEMSSEKSYQVLSDTFGRMLDCAFELRQGSHRRDNDIWYS